MELGLIQVYTGDGKGKTTAALGQGIRAVGRGCRVYMVQFLKSSITGELAALERLSPDFRVFRFEKKRGFIWTLGEEEKQELKQEIKTALEFIKKVFEERQCDLLIMDEILGVLGNKLVDTGELIELLKDKPDGIEVILTGRNAPNEIIEIADYVTEARCVKHPYQRGINAREGIEY